MRAPVLGMYRSLKFVLISFDFKNLETKRHQNADIKVLPTSVMVVPLHFTMANSKP